MQRSFDSVRGDIFGGVTAAVVALPLALAFGVASGLGPVAGLYGAIAVGFFAAVFGGTPAQVSGPTGPMTVVMASIVAQYADRLEIAFAIVFVGGALQALFGLARIGRYISYTPYSVISGFMSGIGLIIILIQLLPFVGLPAASGGPVGAISAMLRAFPQINADAIAVATLSLALMIFWPRQLRRYLPPPLAALVGGTLLGVMICTNAPVLGDVPIGMPKLNLPLFSLHDLSAVIQSAFVLALLGTIDSLLTSLVADSITRTHHDSNRELIGQGIGNMVAGLLGAVPGAGATMRTVVNVSAGGRSRLSGVLHSAILFSLVLGLGPLTERIPHAVLAGILMKVGWDIIDWGYLRRVIRAPREKVIVMFITLALTVFVDLITAVAVGLIIAGFVTARHAEKDELSRVATTKLADDDSLETEERKLPDESCEDIMIVTLRGRFSFASARELTKRISELAVDYKVLVFDFEETSHIDTSAAMAIDAMLAAARAQKIPCVLSGVSGIAEQTLRSLGILDCLARDDIVTTRIDGIRRALTR